MELEDGYVFMWRGQGSKERGHSGHCGENPGHCGRGVELLGKPCEAQEENGLARLKEESCTGQTQEGLFPKPPKVGPRKCITCSRLCPRKCITYLRLFTYV